jgi:hypothetical protein
MPPKQQLIFDAVVWRNICLNRSSRAHFTMNEDDPADHIFRSVDPHDGQSE